jgi:Sucrase/ferredoxin-like
VSILNGSHDTLSKNYDYETVLVFPDYKVVTEVPRSLDGARQLWRNSVNPSVSRPGSTSEVSKIKSWVIPYTCVILICELRLVSLTDARLCVRNFRAEPLNGDFVMIGSHRTRDARCAITAPKLEHGKLRFSSTCKSPIQFGTLLTTLFTIRHRRSQPSRQPCRMKVGTSTRSSTTRLVLH